LRKSLTAMVALGCLMWGQAQASSVACFAPADAKQAELRRMQQEFTVAALSCAVRTEPGALVQRYNQFIGKFDRVLRDNALTLAAHFSRHGGTSGFDSWMTQLANAAAERVATEPDYCQRAWINLEKALTTAPADLAEFAASNSAGGTLVPVCPARRVESEGLTVGLQE